MRRGRSRKWSSVIGKAKHPSSKGTAEADRPTPPGAARPARTGSHPCLSLLLVVVVVELSRPALTCTSP